MSFIQAPSQQHQSPYNNVVPNSSQLGPYPNNAPYFHHPAPQHLPPSVNQQGLSHSTHASPQTQSNSLPAGNENNLFYHLQQQHASQSPNPVIQNQQIPPPQAPPQRQINTPILPPSRNGARSTPNNTQHKAGSNLNNVQAPESQERQAEKIIDSRHGQANSTPSHEHILSLRTEDMIPPPEGSYATFDELMHFANQHAFAHGYALVIARSKKKGLKAFKKVLIACDRWGPVQHSGMRPEHLRKRNTTSKKTDCKFGFHAVESATEWKLIYRQESSALVHNHGPSLDMSKHAAARKLNPAAMAAIKMYSDAGLSVKETVEQIHIAQPGAMVIARDVYNARALLKREPARFPTMTVNPSPQPSIVTRPQISPEQKIRDECRQEVAKAKEETDAARREIEELKKQIATKDKMIEKFEMFIDICNGRVMAQRERLTDDGNIGSGNGII